MTVQQSPDMFKEHVAEAIGSVQQDLLQELLLGGGGCRLVEESEAAELVRGVDREDEMVHWVSV